MKCHDSFPLTIFPLGEKSLRGEEVNSCNVIRCIEAMLVLLWLWCGARAPRPRGARASLGSLRPRDALSHSFHWLASLHIILVLVIGRLLDVLAWIRAGGHHLFLCIPLHHPDVEEVRSAPPAADRFDIIRGDALVKEGGCSPNPDDQDTTATSPPLGDDDEFCLLSA